MQRLNSTRINKNGLSRSKKKKSVQRACVLSQIHSGSTLWLTMARIQRIVGCPDVSLFSQSAPHLAHPLWNHSFLNHHSANSSARRGRGEVRRKRWLANDFQHLCRRFAPRTSAADQLSRRFRQALKPAQENCFHPLTAATVESRFHWIQSILCWPSIVEH